MNKCAIMLFLIVFGVKLNAQECLYLTNKVSGMDGTRLIITQPLLLSRNFNGGTLEVWSTLKGDTAIIVAFVLSNKPVLNVKQNDSVRITLESSETMSIPVLQDATTIRGDENQLTIMTMIPDSMILKLESAPVKEIIIPANTGDLHGFPGNKRQSISLQKVTRCVKEYRFESSR